MKMTNKLANAYLMYVHSHASNGKPIGLWLHDYDANAYEGRGQASLTKYKDRAKRFESKEAAFEYWRQVSKRQPKRDDGKPNRPLTAYTIELLPENEEPTP